MYWLYPFITPEINGWWNGVKSADLDQDGDMDLIATNFGLNTKYHTSADHPVLLYYGKFGTEKMRLVQIQNITPKIKNR